MGEAKQRKYNDPTFGLPCIFILQLFDKAHNHIVDIPLTIKRRAKRLLTCKDALSMSGVLLAYLINPTTENWQCVETSIASYCANLDGIPDLETFKEWSEVLPVEFWAWVRETHWEGDRMVIGEVLESRDNASGAKCRVTFASREGVAPAQEGVSMRRFQAAVFERELLGAKK